MCRWSWTSPCGQASTKSGRPEALDETFPYSVFPAWKSSWLQSDGATAVQKFCVRAVNHAHKLWCLIDTAAVEYCLIASVSKTRTVFVLSFFSEQGCLWEASTRTYRVGTNCSRHAVPVSNGVDTTNKPLRPKQWSYHYSRSVKHRFVLWAERVYSIIYAHAVVFDPASLQCRDVAMRRIFGRLKLLFTRILVMILAFAVPKQM